MKQVLNATKSFVRGFSRHHTIIQSGFFTKCRFILLAVGLAIVISSFQSENPHKKSVPFKGEYIFSFEGQGVSGTGLATHVGRFDLVEENNLDGFPIITGTATITAANGDQIFATHTGLIQIVGDGIAQVDSEFIITGGTGRFTGATGSFNSHGPANLYQGSGSATFDGNLNQ